MFEASEAIQALLGSAWFDLASSTLPLFALLSRVSSILRELRKAKF